MYSHHDLLVSLSLKNFGLILAATQSVSRVTLEAFFAFAAASVFFTLNLYITIVFSMK